MVAETITVTLITVYLIMVAHYLWGAQIRRCRKLVWGLMIIRWSAYRLSTEITQILSLSHEDEPA